VPVDHAPSWPWSKWCPKCKGDGTVPRALLSGHRECPRCEGNGIVATVWYFIAERRATGRR
jgi:DnaJ-class molecular chaperone